MIWGFFFKNFESILSPKDTESRGFCSCSLVWLRFLVLTRVSASSLLQ